MFSTETPKRPHSFFAYLSLSFLAVYAVCAFLLYLIVVHVIAKTARAFERDDIRSDSLEYAEILRHNASGSWLAEEIALENLPATTLFAVRIVEPGGKVLYAASQPKDIAVPGGWATSALSEGRPPPKEGWQDIYLPAYRRRFQVKTTRLADGRLLQVGRGTTRESVQEGFLLRTTFAFFALASLFVIANGAWIMFMTLRPLKRITADMSGIIESGVFDRSPLPTRSSIAEINTLGVLFGELAKRNAALITAMKGTLDNVAHDFRTPLTRIRSGAEFALNARNPPASREVLLGVLEDIVEDCDAARLQLQNLLDLRSLESGFVKLQTQRFDLKAALAEIADLYAVMAEEKSIDLRVELPEGGVPFDGDPAQLSQALANLIDNAIKYTPGNGHVRVTLESDSGGPVRIAVADDGIGIPPDEHALVWQRLFRSRNARSEKGLGLGLSLAKSLIEAHGGTLVFSSAPGQGTTFVATLPPADSSAPGLSPAG